MAVRSTSKSGEVPKDAIRLSEAEAIDYHWNLIRNWPNILEVWPYKIGIPILASLGCASGLIVNHHIRKRLKLRAFGLLSTNAAIGLAPAIVVSAVHPVLITSDVYIGKTRCNLCLQQKAAVLQVLFGLIYPMTLSPIANSMYATRHGTYRLPHYTEYTETAKLWWSFIKQGRGKFLGLAAGHALLAAFITWNEQLTIIRLREKFAILDKELDEEKATKEWAKNQLN